MRIKRSYISLLFVLFSLTTTVHVQAQNTKRKQLEQKRKRLQKEMAQLNKLLFNSRKKTHSAYTQVVNLNRKIELRTKLIHSFNNEINALTEQINANKDSIAILNKETDALRKQYGAMLRQAQKNDNASSFFMFILASDNISQAYNRMEYIKQYNAFRKKQIKTISSKSKQLETINDSLNNQIATKKTLILDNESQKKAIVEDKSSKDKLYNQLKHKEKDYKKKLAANRKKQREIDRAIEKSITRAIKKSSGGKTKFKLSTEGKKLAASFKASYGKLPWPVAKGIVLRYFGKQHNAVYKDIVTELSGVEIATSKNANARAVFKGKVSAIIIQKGGNKAVIIKHGNYLTVYSNLSKVFVQKGDMVNAKEAIGEIFYNRHTDKTVLMFQIWNNTKKLNPAPWVYNM